MTIEWDGWWFDIEPRLIRARPAHHGIGRDLEFRFDDIRPSTITYHIRSIMEAVNAGARLRGRAVRSMLGIPDERQFNSADQIWDGSKSMYLIQHGTLRTVKMPILPGDLEELL